MDLSIIIVSWNTRDLLAQCLQSVYDTAQGLAFEVVVVDNASTDGSAAMVRERFANAPLLRNSDNVGFARANNQAIERCSGRHICLLNPDTIVFPGALQTLADFIASRPQVGFCGPRVMNPDGSLQVSWGSFPTLGMEILPLRFRLFLSRRGVIQDSYVIGGASIDRPTRVEWLSGACLIVGRRVLEDVGGLDEDYFMYAEEMDWCLRARQRGLEAWYVPSARIVHHRQAASRQVALRSYADFNRSRVLFFSKHYGRTTTLAYRGYLLAKSLLYALRTRSSPMCRDYPELTSAQVRGVYLDVARLAIGML